jgi:NAD(P)-dependent dehydrogenase (short-subunit alcohol dehydrogenase family)
VADLQVALVTGASSGIGRATAELLARRGYRVFGVSRRAPDPLLPDVRDRWIAMDVRDEAAVSEGVAHVLSHAGRIDALVLCAGYSVFGSVEEVPLAKAREQIETNLIGTLIPLRAVLPAMRQAGRGRIVVVGSLAGRAPIPFQAHYSATKAALDALTLALRLEVAPLGIGVSLVEPGDINTPFNEHVEWGDTKTSAYADRLGRCERVVRESLPKAPGPDVVAQVILRALTAGRPRVRYTVGLDSLLVPLGRRLLPDWLSLALIRDHFKV